jgi:dTDP-glucose pyrophosphorylase
MLAAIRDILLVSTPEHLSFYRHLLGDGADWGIRLEYVVQDKPCGLAHAFILGRQFVGRDRVALILGDIFSTARDSARSWWTLSRVCKARPCSPIASAIPGNMAW